MQGQTLGDIMLVAPGDIPVEGVGGFDHLPARPNNARSKKRQRPRCHHPTLVVRALNMHGRRIGPRGSSTSK